MSSLTRQQCRAARGLLGWSQQKLAESARISQATIAAFESGTSIPMINNLLAIQAALEAAGVAFIPENGGGPGVRLKDPIREA